MMIFLRITGLVFLSTRTRGVLYERLSHRHQSLRPHPIFQTVNEVHGPAVIRRPAGAFCRAVQRLEMRVSPITPVGRDDQPPTLHTRNLIEEARAFANRPDLD